MAENKSYWQRKHEAFRKYGKAQTRPQKNFKEFLLAKRRLNLGLRDLAVKRSEVIDAHFLSAAALKFEALPMPSPFIVPSYEIVDNEEKFDQMLDNLGDSNEVMIDAEFNNDHSYFGMICWIQLHTCGTTYLVDPFPTFEKICNNLNIFFQDTSVLKVMFGCANDVMGLHRDFDSTICGCIDVQLLHREMMARILRALQAGDSAAVYAIFDKQQILEKMTGLQENQKVSSDQLVGIKKAATDLISLTSLAGIYFPKLEKPDDATFADWRIRPLENLNMIHYAVYDVSVLHGIWQQMKTLVKLPFFEGTLEAALESTKNLLKKTFVPPQRKDPSISLPEEQKELANYLLTFRSLHAQIIDEPPAEVLSTREIVEMVRRKPTDDEGLQRIVQLVRRSIPESYESWNKPVLRIINEGRVFFDKLMSPPKCHVCNGKFAYPHLAFGCVESYSSWKVARFMYQPENRYFSEKEYQRRLTNWERKNRNKECPYLPKRN